MGKVFVLAQKGAGCQIKLGMKTLQTELPWHSLWEAVLEGGV